MHTSVGLLLQSWYESENNSGNDIAFFAFTIHQNLAIVCDDSLFQVQCF